MTEPYFLRFRFAIALVSLASVLTLVSPSRAQNFPPPQGGVAANPVCQRLEAQLAMVDRGTTDPARAEQIRRYEDAASRQAGELERVTNHAKRMGCDSSGFFALFSNQSAQCGPVNSQIQQMRANLDQITTSIERLRGRGGAGSFERDQQRRSVLAALAQNNCGPQYASHANQGGGFFDTLFGGGNNNVTTPPPEEFGAPASTYKTVCVRTCDGFYFPVSYATTPARFADDEQACKSLCPAAEATLFTFHSNEDMTRAVSINGQPYTALPNAFKYRQAFNPACSCKAQGQTWAEALKGIDDRGQQGDIIVTDERARQMLQSRDAQGRPVRIPAQQATGSPAQASEAPAATAPATPPPADRPIRTVGPPFIPATK
ncbi:DUF2865 domain-containing protein [Bradyrhizobium sp. LHD-71]|uniref:DUF2865 domain-containing protein n=1 Tax=Bradyrhizobium sp. LHD-71 TaxID=3072141 RepID=UPI00280CE18F|nr:DUF2865 domain-containing protein [Bradyrhizobium sp. LHD-71]MDQ8728645.1 DUF2865 domain-containing protein [Bradyrhizobium sp. LHD-71]